MAGDSLLLPIGHYLGVEHRPQDRPQDRLEPLADHRAERSADRVHQIRVGNRFHELTDEQFGIWALAHGEPSAMVAGAPWTRSDVEAAAGDRAELSRIVDGLHDLGLLAEVATGPLDGRAFAERYRLVPIMLGVGNSVAEPAVWDIGFVGRPAIGVSLPTYETWQWSAVADTLWMACQATAAEAVASGSVDPQGTQPQLVLDGTMEALHPLLAASAAYLDVPFTITVPEGLG